MIVRTSVPLRRPPSWALRQRRLLDGLAEAAALFSEAYTEADGALRFGGTLQDRDGNDDFYECFGNWPLAYLLGGGDALLTSASRHWEGVTSQLTRMGRMTQEYEQGYDWFHQGESNLLLYSLALAAPEQDRWARRLARFADLYARDATGEVFDPTHRMITHPHTGSLGARPGLFDVLPGEEFWDQMLQYGVPVPGIAGAERVADLTESPVARAAMIDALQTRLGVGDVLVNLASTSLATSAFVQTGDDTYREWVLSYADAWMGRRPQRASLVADNVGPDGVPGQLLGGRWHGGLYGWGWPHGITSVLPALAVGMTNAFLLSGETRYLDFLREHLDFFIGRARSAPLTEAEGPYADDVLAHVEEAQRAARVPLVEHRRDDTGWFERRPFPLQTLAALISLTGDRQDFARYETLSAMFGQGYDRVWTFRDKEESGHEQPWLDFLLGRLPSFPDEALASAEEVLAWRCDLIRGDHADLSAVDIHHLQQHNPVVVEALCQTITGAQPPIYNGGLFLPRLIPLDVDRGRPGLPCDCACLVTAVVGDRIDCELVNLSATTTHTISLLPDAYQQRRWVQVQMTDRSGDWPGSLWSEVPPQTGIEHESLDMELGDTLRVELAPSTGIRLRLRSVMTASPPRRQEWWSS